MKRNFLCGVFVGLLFFLFSLSFVNASSINFDAITEGVGDVFRAIFIPLLGGGFDEYFFAKVLLFVILFLVIRVVLVTFPPFEDKKGIVLIISLAVSLISVRYIGELDLIKAVLIPYGTLAIAIMTLIPFLIYFFFVNKAIGSAGGRKIAWILYMMILFGIWSNIQDRLNEIGTYIYGAVFILAICLILFDKTVRKYFGMRSNYQYVRETIDARIAALQTEYQNILSTNTPAAESRRKQIHKEIKKLEDEKHKWS